MIYLDTTAKKLEIVLEGAVAANQPQCTVNYFDVKPQTKDDSSNYRGSMYNADANSTNDVTICPAPSKPGVVRNVKSLTIYNKDIATVNAVIKVDGGTEYILVRKAIGTKQTLFYEDGYGWWVL